MGSGSRLSVCFLLLRSVDVLRNMTALRHGVVFVFYDEFSAWWSILLRVVILMVRKGWAWSLSRRMDMHSLILLHVSIPSFLQTLVYKWIYREKILILIISHTINHLSYYQLVPIPKFANLPSVQNHKFSAKAASFPWELGSPYRSEVCTISLPS